MKIWRVVIKDAKEGEYSTKTYRGEADTYVQAGDRALGLACEDGFKNPRIDEVCCYGKKDF